MMMLKEAKIADDVGKIKTGFTLCYEMDKRGKGRVEKDLADVLEVFYAIMNEYQSNLRLGDQIGTHRISSNRSPRRIALPELLLT